MEIKLSWEDFVLLFFPLYFFLFQCVGYIIVTVAVISSHQEKKGIKKIPSSIMPVFLFETKHS